MRMHISFAGGMTILVSHMYEIRPEKDYPELSVICPNKMHCGTKSVVGNASVSIIVSKPAPMATVRMDKDRNKVQEEPHRIYSWEDVCMDSVEWKIQILPTDQH